jgi:MATE family multidrug resistance protein
MIPYRECWRLAWPLILANLSVPLLGLVDTAVVGHLPDPSYLGGVALGATLISVLYFLFGFLRMGTTALAAQALGAGDEAEVMAALARGLVLAAGLGCLLILLGGPILALAMRLFAPGPAIAANFALFLEIRLLGAPAALANFVQLGWLLGRQDSRSPLVLLIATNLLNAALAVGLVLGLGMGVAGVATATVIAEYAGLGVGFLLVRRHRRRLGGRLPDRATIFRRAPFLRLLAINRDLFLRSLMLEAAFLGFTALSSRQGDIVLAANAVLMNFFTLAAYGLDGFAHAAEAMVARAVGARDARGFQAAARAGFALAGLLALALVLIFWLAGSGVVALLTGIAAVRDAANLYLPYVALIPVVAVWAFVFDGIFFGATRTAELRNAMAAALTVFAAMAFTLPPALGNHGLWLAMLIFLAARGLLLALVYRRAEDGAAFARG